MQKYLSSLAKLGHGSTRHPFDAKKHKIRVPSFRGGEKVASMYTHRQIWAAIDALAERRGWSIGRLAVTAGLDPTSLNPSKRLGIGAKPRWPSTETLCKLLSASNTSFSTFADMV